MQAVRAYDATPEWLSKGIAYGLPVLELCLAVLLILGVITRIAAAITAVLLLVFLIGIIQAGVAGIKLECGCFGGGGPTAQDRRPIPSTSCVMSDCWSSRCISSSGR